VDAFGLAIDYFAGIPGKKIVVNGDERRFMLDALGAVRDHIKVLSGISSFPPKFEVDLEYGFNPFRDLRFIGDSAALNSITAGCKKEVTSYRNVRGRIVLGATLVDPPKILIHRRWLLSKESDSDETPTREQALGPAQVGCRVVPQHEDVPKDRNHPAQFAREHLAGPSHD